MPANPADNVCDSVLTAEVIEVTAPDVVEAEGVVVLAPDGIVNSAVRTAVAKVA